MLSCRLPWRGCCVKAAVMLPPCARSDSERPTNAEIWRYAVQQQAAIVTKDEDFAERSLYSRDQPVIVWLRIGNTSNQALLRWFVPLWPEIMRRIELGDRLIEVS
jgi:predicted nuclease of predicted toxin-antitoxin system